LPSRKDTLRSIAGSLLIVFTLTLSAQRPHTVARGVTEDPAAWLQRHSVPLGDLDATLPWFANARIVALGDATHGTHEFFAVKRQLIEILVREGGFRTIAFEAPFGEWETIREYVLTGSGDPAASLESPDYFFWDAEEVLGLIEWARRENERGIDPPIEIVGVDSSHPHPVIDRVLASIADARLRDDVAARYHCLAQYRRNPESYEYLGRPSCRDSVLSVSPLLQASGASRELLHAARVVEQGEETLRTKLANRDAALAENLEWLDRKVIFWGHNAHIGKTPYRLLPPDEITSAGTILAQKVGYVAIGTVALRGRFWAYEYTAGYAFLAEQTMTMPAEDDYANWFRAAGTTAMLIPLRGTLPRWLATPRPTRIAGSSVISRARATIDVVEDFAQRYDAVIYFEETTPSQLRHFPRR
jgi:erythromycin esterase